MAPAPARSKEGSAHALTPARPPVAAPTAPAPAAAPPSTPAAAPPSTPTQPTVEPFLNPQNLQDLSGFNYNQDSQNAALDKGLADQRANTSYQLQQLAKTFQANSTATADAWAARGLYHSSVKDAAMYDLEATKSLQQQFLNDQLQTAGNYADAQKLALSNYATEFLKGLNASAVQNAQSVSAATPPVDPVTTAPAPTTAAPARSKEGTAAPAGAVLTPVHTAPAPAPSSSKEGKVA